MSAGITKIGGTACAAQVSCGVELILTPTADSGNDAAGGNHTTVYPEKYALTPLWPHQTKADRATLMGLIKSVNTQAKSLEFVSPITNTTLTKTFRLISMGPNNAFLAGIDLVEPFSCRWEEN